MRLYRLLEDVDFPEKVTRAYGEAYLNLRSNERIDIRPKETREIFTGFRLGPLGNEKVYVVDNLTDTKNELFSGEIIYIKITNPSGRNYMIYPGQVIGSLEVHKC